MLTGDYVWDRQLGCQRCEKNNDNSSKSALLVCARACMPGGSKAQLLGRDRLTHLRHPLQRHRAVRLALR